MNIKYTLLFKIVVAVGIPALVAGLFIFQHSFPTRMANAGISLFLAASVAPSIAALAFAVAIQRLPEFLRGSPGMPSPRTAQILSGVALVVVLWAVIAATESILRLLYFAVFESNMSALHLMSTSSIVLGMMGTIVLGILIFQEIRDSKLPARSST